MGDVELAADPEMKVELVQDGAILNDRSCTDCCMLPVFTVFMIGWAIVASYATLNGKPSRMLLPENFRGDLCGDTETPLEFYPDLFVPKPSRLSYGLCVPECPGLMDYVCNNDLEPRFKPNPDPNDEVYNHYYNHNTTEYLRGQKLVFQCSVLTCTDAEKEDRDRYLGLLTKVSEYKCFVAFYQSGATLYRCLPFQDKEKNQTLGDLLGEGSDGLEYLADKTGAGSFFNRGFSEVQYSWYVIAICCGTACVISIIWIFLLRWIIGPIVYLCIILIFAALVLIGYFAYWMANDLEQIQLPGEQGTEDQVKVWRAIQYIFWILAGIYFIAMIWLLKRIRIAIAIMKEGSKAFCDNPGLVLVPIIVLILLMGILAVFIVVLVYIQTIGKKENVEFTAAAVNVFGEDAVNATFAVAEASSEWANSTLNFSTSNYTVNTTGWTAEDVTKYLHAYNFFAFLWVGNFCIMYGFFIMAFVTCVWYYSATTIELDRFDRGEEGGRLKGTAIGTSLRCFCSTTRYHLGTVLWGALLIAIIQFVRAVFLYLQEEFLDRWKDNATIKCVIYCIDCCLQYIERVVKIISKSAFIICIIKNKSFCSSAFETLQILVVNCLRVTILGFLAVIAHFILKIFIVVSNMIVAYYLIQVDSLTQGQKIESGLFPLSLIFVITYIIASLFINVFESCTDTVMMCFLIDEKDFAGVFMPISLSELLDNFKAVEMARRDYEERITYATNEHEPAPKKKASHETEDKKDEEDI